MLKKPWFQNKHCDTLTNWIWPILLSKHSINLLTPQSHFLFLKPAYQSRLSKTKTEELELSKIYLPYCKNNNEELELPNYFQKLIFNQQTAASQKVPSWARSLRGAFRAPPLLRHWSYTWCLSCQGSFFWRVPVVNHKIMVCLALGGRGVHGSGLPESTSAGLCVFFRIRSQNFVKNRIRGHSSISAVVGVCTVTS